jgi:NADH-quinone oxidoreductase subunit N
MNFKLLLPEIILFSGALIILIADVFFNKKNQRFPFFAHFFSLIICGLALSFAVKSFGEPQLSFNDGFKLTAIICFFKSIIISLLTVIVLISIRYVFLLPKYSSEYLALLMIATVGGLIMVSANDLLVFYLGLELQALSLYLLASFTVKSPKSSEAGIKYFILGSLASGILLFGISLVYGYFSTINLAQINDFVTNTKIAEIPVGGIFGIIMIITAMFFKISASPFHMWAPDVYQGSPTSVLAFFGTVVKFSTIMALILIVNNATWHIVAQILLFVAMASVIVGSFGAIFQTNIKRLMAFSSISHVGFILLALASLQKSAIESAIFYTIIYAVISLGSLSFLTIFKSPDNHENDSTDDKIFNINSLAGLSKTNPVMAMCFAVLMFSSAGIPPLAGFFSKFYVIKSMILGGNLVLAVIVVIFSAISSFYYLRIIKIMYFDQPNNQLELEDYGNTRLVVLLCAIANLGFILAIDILNNSISNFLN